MNCRLKVLDGILVQNNPVNFVDPWGLWTVQDTIGVGLMGEGLGHGALGIFLVGAAFHETGSVAGLPLVPHTLGAAGLQFGMAGYAIVKGWNLFNDPCD